jgi:pyruvate,water dikinase
MNKYIIWFKNINIGDVNLVGGKNASLGEMYQNLQNLGIKIPNGFAVSTEGYDRFLDSNNLKEKIDDIMKTTDVKDMSSLQKSGKAIRTLLTESVIPKDMKVEIARNYEKLSEYYKMKDTDVAVRSSATAEDLPDASFAGQQDTYLNIRGINNLFESIKKCFASLYTDRAISYRDKFNFDNVKLSICIQKMVRSDVGSAGVAFSLDPDYGYNKVIVINSAFGLGETVVGGEITPDEYIVFKPTMTIIERKLGRKDRKMIYGKTSTTLIENKDNSHSLKDDKILLLAKWVKIIEEYYSKIHKRDSPMDVEWAVDGKSDELFIVQARPETVHSNNKSKTCIKEYKLLEEGKEILKGIAVGHSIASGKVRILDKIQGAVFDDGDILVADITDPSWEPIMKRASAIITNRGGRTCHAAIVARELGVPAIVATINCTVVLKENQVVTVCNIGETGVVYDGYVKNEMIATNITNIPETKTKIMMNIACPEKAFQYCQLPHQGVGLLRVEFIMSNSMKIHPLALLNYNTLRGDLRREMDKILKGQDPREYFVERLAFGIARIVAAFHPFDVIIRFSDFKTNEYRRLLGGDIFESIEENPMLGWRGCSRYYSDSYQEAFGLECKAIKYVREEMNLRNAIVMLPFCRTVKECIKVQETMKRYGLERGKEDLKLYLMAEIPANAILADRFLEHADGFSLGTNDMTQLTLGVDRDSELVSSVFDERDDAVKEMIRMVIKSAKKLGKYVGICGDAPSSLPDFAEFLVKEGIESMSLTPDSLVKTKLLIAKIEE